MCDLKEIRKIRLRHKKGGVTASGGLIEITDTQYIISQYGFILILPLRDWEEI